MVTNTMNANTIAAKMTAFCDTLDAEPRQEAGVFGTQPIADQKDDGERKPMPEVHSSYLPNAPYNFG